MDFSTQNGILDWTEVTPDSYLKHYKGRITQDSEKLFVTDFLFALLGNNLKYIIPQFPFLDSEGKSRRIDFAVVDGRKKIALEVNGETYHAEGIIPNEMFDDNLNRQNEILVAGYKLLRFSYSQLQSPIWRQRISEALRKLFYTTMPELLPRRSIDPNPLQQSALEALDFYRGQGWKKGIIILPTGTGKTYLSAFDTLKTAGRILFIVHRLDILSQSKESFEKVYPTEVIGLLTGEFKENIQAKILFASKDSLRNPETLSQFKSNEFDYIIIDEVHHGQAPSYKIILDYFEPSFFMLGLTATPDRLDRKDIFEIFDYQKIYEVTLSEAIENGYLVPYTYYGLNDNIDYSNIRFSGNKYNVADLDRKLIIPERNEQILVEYLAKGQGNKGLGFCSSINHANAMASYFTSKGVPAFAITAETPNRADLIKKYRNNEFNVAFTVDLFNEGVDFPDLRVLMFLRPTESKTVFLQQLGRGLRLCSGKDNVVILDFISNYKKANNIRKFLAKSSQQNINAQTGRVEKITYEYTPKCNVVFDAEVETILDRQDTLDREISKEDLTDAYYKVAEELERKPTQEEVSQLGEFRIGRYIAVFGSWVKFLRDIGEFTEASYHFPQGTHLGHVFYILKTINSGQLDGTHLDSQYVRIRGSLSKEDRVGGFQRQTKYKLQALMELGLIVDDRTLKSDEEFILELTPKGKVFTVLLNPFIENLNLEFKDKGGEIPSWEMVQGTRLFNEQLSEYLSDKPEIWEETAKIFMHMHAVQLMLNYLYRIERESIILKSSIYNNFFKAPFISAYCDQNGIDAATEEGAAHRCPFLLNILEALGIVTVGTNDVTITQFLICTPTMKLGNKESDQTVAARIDNVYSNHQGLDDEDISLLKEAFGATFLTEQYFLKVFKVLK